MENERKLSFNYCHIPSLSVLLTLHYNSDDQQFHWSITLSWPKKNGLQTLSHLYLPGVTTYVIAGISKLSDYPPFLNYKVSFSASKAITIHLPQNKNVLAVPDEYLNGIYEDRLLKCGWLCKHLTTADHVDHLCITCIGNSGKNTVVKCVKTNCSFCAKPFIRWSKIFMGTAKSNYITESAIETL